METIKTTGQQAIVRTSVIAGQPLHTYIVNVVRIDGDTLIYSNDGIWEISAIRSELLDWELIEEGTAVPSTFTPGQRVRYDSGDGRDTYGWITTAPEPWNPIPGYEFVRDSRGNVRLIEVDVYHLRPARP